MAGEHYHELLWDYLYGLLDEAETRNLRAHVETCPACRTALAEAEGQKQMLARAARVVNDVPAFTLPGQDQEPAAGDVPAEAPPAMLTMPLPAQIARRPALRRYWPAWAAAAAFLVAAIGLNNAYQEGLSRREAQVAQMRTKVQAVDGLFAALQTDVAKKKEEQARRLQQEMPLQLNVLAPGQVLAEGPAVIRVAALDLEGKPQEAEITTTLLEPASGKVLQQHVDRIEGQGTVQVPGPKMGPAARLRVEAKAGKGEAKIEETLRVAEPSHASHLALDKSIYNTGDLLFFRTLTLDRYTLKPPAKPLPLRFALLDANGRTVRALASTSGRGGISAGEMAVTPDLASGNYTFQVSAADGNNAVLLPQHRGLEIVHDDTPRIAFDRNFYVPGDKVGINIQGGQGGNNANANKGLSVTMNADGQPVPPTLNQAPPRFDPSGNLNNYQLQLPQHIKRAEIVVAMKDGKKDNKLVQSIPIISAERTIDFFPEGGDLVAGVPNRVYYRVRSSPGEPVHAEGHVIVLAGTEVLYDSKRSQELGSFTFTPDASVSYSVRLSGSQGSVTIANPFQKLGIKAQGVLLHAPQSVSREGDPLALVLRNQGPARRLLLQSICRGQIVDHQYVDLQPGSREMKLEPAPGAAGVLRVTAWDVSADRLVPLAERLLYRVPEKRLDVSCEITSGPGPYAAGTNITMKLKATDERKNAGPAWMLAAVVDEKYRLEKNERSLAAHFYLAGDLAGDDVDNADLVLNDTPASRQALDLFLGTEGWRRFLPGETAALLALRDAPAKDDAGTAASASAAFFSLQNTTRQNLQDTYQKALQKEVSELIGWANHERANLIDQKDTNLEVLGQAARELAEFQELPDEYFRLALGILALVLLAAGGAFLVVGVVRLVRKKEASPTVHFAGAFSCLFACLVLYVVAGHMPPGDVVRADSHASAQRAAWSEFSVDNVKIATSPTTPPASAPVPPSPPVGYFVAQAVPAAQEMERTPLSPSVKGGAMAESLAKRNEATVTRAQTFSAIQAQNNQVQNMGINDPQRQVRQSSEGNQELRRRFAQAAAKAKEQVPGPPLPPSAKPTAQAARGAAELKGPGGFGAMKAGADANNGAEFYFREYAHRGTQQRGRVDLQDTLFWSPLLDCADGQAQVSFDLSQNLTTYRVLIYANSPSGRLGFYEGKLEVRPGAQK